MSAKRFDFLILVLLLLVGTLFSFDFKDSVTRYPLISAILFLLPPGCYLGWRKKKNWRKIAVAVLVFGALFGFIFDFVAEYTKAYSVQSTIFPRLFGVIPVDNVLGHMIMTFITIMFYEHFLDRDRHKKIGTHIWYAIIPAILVILLILGLYYTNPSLLISRYPYFYMGIVAILPVFFLALRQPKLIPNLAITAIFFFFLYFIFEVTAISLNYWIYAGNNYIGWVQLFNLRFPFEELFFWMLFYASCLISYYELFVNNR